MSFSFSLAGDNRDLHSFPTRRSSDLSLAYLNHPLREADSERFIQPGLELVAEIQRTGDIFFPSAWTGSMLWGHRTPRAAAMVHDFLAKELQYPERLRWTVLSSADDLFRAAALSAR